MALNVPCVCVCAQVPEVHQSTSPATDALGVRPVFTFRNVPVPMVTFTSPSSKQQEPNKDAAWSAT
jgi:hypothetical protein